MVYDLQKASLWKRVASWMFDSILTGVLAVGLAFLLSAILGYNGYNEAVDRAYAKYEAEYGMVFEISQDEYQSMSEGDRENYDAAYNALIADEEAMYAYNMMLHLSLVITTFGILISVLVLEFFVPLLFGNGQTLGKKMFSLCLMRNDGVKLNNMQLFARTVLGKYAVETMIPVYILMMLMWGTMDITGTVIILGLAAAEIISLAATRNNCAIHDLLAGTVVVDISSQMIFGSTDELIAYQKKLAAERAARQTY